MTTQTCNFEPEPSFALELVAICTAADVLLVEAPTVTTLEAPLEAPLAIAAEAVTAAADVATTTTFAVGPELALPSV